MSEQSEREQRAVRRARWRLEHALEQIEKRHYLNALHVINEAEKLVIEAFDAVLKSNRPDALS